MPTIIDTHAHLDQLEDVDKALNEAWAAGVVGIVAVGVDLASNQKNLSIRKRYQQPKIHLACGIHPGNIKPEETQECLSFIRKHRSELIAIGETGLDYWYKWVRKDEAKKAEQREIFQLQLDLAAELDLPMIVHSRGAWKDCLEMSQAAKLKKVLFHWYSGPLDILKKILENGYLVSTSPSVAYSPQSQAAMTYAPLDRILIETDSPVFYQEPEPGFQAAPKDVYQSLWALARLKKLPEEEALPILNANAIQFFKL